MRLTTSFADAVAQYALQVSQQATLGHMARYVSQQEAYIDASTLELAHELKDEQTIQDINYQPGDRLVIFKQAPTRAELPGVLAPGDKILRFSRGNFQVTSGSKKRLVVGKTATSVNPDIDLRNFVPGHYLDFVSRESLVLEFDSQRKTWSARRAGRTRIGIDELELGEAPQQLGHHTRLRFYRGNDDPRNPASRPIGEILVQMEEVRSQTDVIALPAGDYTLPLLVGSEDNDLVLEVSEQINIQTLAQNLLQKLDIPAHSGLYLMRLLAPTTTAGTVHLGPGRSLYASRQLGYAQNTLILRDVHQRDRQFEIPAGLEDEQRLVGRRTQPQQTDPDLDIDLYQVLVGKDGDPEAYRSISRQQARIFYRDNEWRIQLVEGARVPVFVNQMRVTTGIPAPLASGDAISFGPSVNQYVARLEVEITTR
jgi:hypothetical protein